MPDQRVEPTIEDFANALLDVIEGERQRAFDANDGKPSPFCLDEGHTFLCRFPKGSCRRGMCNDD